MFGVHDIPLPLPASEALLKGMLVIFFLIHIIFVELMVGASILSTFFEWLGVKRKNDFYDSIAFEVAKTITVNKSMAVVMGVGPLLLINVTYTMFFYSSSVFIGDGWILVIPLAIIAFLLTYLHQYAWDKFSNFKNLHISVSLLASFLFLVIPFFFLANTNLMWFPKDWNDINGFLSSLAYSNIFARYLFFVAAAFTSTSLYLMWSFDRNEDLRSCNSFTHQNFENVLIILTRFIVLFMVIQFFAAVLMVITANSASFSVDLLPYFILTGVLFFVAFALIVNDWRKYLFLRKESFKIVCVFLFFSIFFGGILRHKYRENSLDPYVKQMKINTEKFMERVEEARQRYGTEDYRYEK